MVQVLDFESARQQRVAAQKQARASLAAARRHRVLSDRYQRKMIPEFWDAISGGDHLTNEQLDQLGNLLDCFVIDLADCSLNAKSRRVVEKRSQDFAAGVTLDRVIPDDAEISAFIDFFKISALHPRQFLQKRLQDLTDLRGRDGFADIVDILMLAHYYEHSSTIAIPREIARQKAAGALSFPV